MTDNIQEFNNYFAYIMEGILQSLYDFPSTSLYLILGISFVFHIISIKQWFDNRAKNEAIWEIIQSLQANNGQSVEKINTMERDSINLTELSQRICVVEFNTWNMLKIMIGWQIRCLSRKVICTLSKLYLRMRCYLY